MGVVYRAEDERLGRQVALKVLPADVADDPRAKDRLLAEARAAATLDHPNVCTVYEVGETDEGQPFIALACYEGETLADRLARGPLPVPEAVRLARGMAAGVAAAHARDIVHRDLKPSNVFLCEDGTPKVLDFGIAKRPDAALTRTGETAGTLAYGAPEQAQGAADARSDVWALGAVLYEMLTGRQPFQAPYGAAVLYAVLHEDPPPPSTLADVPPALDAVVARCLAKDPDARFADAAALGHALSDADAGASTLHLGPAASALHRSRAARAVAAAVLVGLVAAGAWAIRTADVTELPAAVHLAILPPSTLPDGPDDRAFAEGLAEMLAGGIGALAPPGREVWVVPASEVRDLDVTSARQAGAALGANLAVTGRLRRDGDRLTLSLSLATAGDRPRLLGSGTMTVSRAQEGSLRALALGLLADLLEFPDGDEDQVAAQTADPEAQEYYLRGVGYLERDRDAEDLDRAIDFFEQAIDVDPAFAAAHARLAEAAVERYRTTRDSTWIGRAEEAGRTAVELDEREPLSHVALSRLYHATGRYPLAVREARRALALDERSTNALVALAGALEASGDAPAAEAALRRSVSFRPGLWSGHAELGNLYWRLGRYSDADAAFGRVVSLAPENFQGHYSRAAVAQQTGNLGAAVVAYRRAIDIRPHYGAYTNLASILRDEGRPREAVEMYHRALELDSTDHRTWANLSSAYADIPGARNHQDRTLRRALVQTERALAVNPNDAATLAAFAGYAVNLGREADGRRSATRAADLAPDDVDVQFRAGYALAELGDTDAALDLIERAVDGGYPIDAVAASPGFDALRRTSRYAALVARSGGTD